MDDLTNATRADLLDEIRRLRGRVAAPARAPDAPDLAAWFNSVSDAIFVTDLDGRIVHWNRAAEQIYCWSRAESRTIYEALPPEYSAQLAPLYRAALAGAPSAHEITVGGDRHAVYVTPIVDADGAIRSGMVMTHNITQQKQAEDQMRRAADRLATLRAIDRAILQVHAPATIVSAVLARVRELIPCRRATVVLHDPSGGASILSANGDFAGALPAGSPLPPLPEAVVTAMRRGEPDVHHDLRWSAGDNPFSHQLLGAGIRSVLRVPMIAHWELIGTLNLVATEPGAFTDEDIAIVQEIGNTLAIALHNARLVESLQQELAARTRAEAALVAEHARVVRMKNEFMATMSHELRTPLAAVLGRAELLQDQIYGPLNERQSAALRTVEQSGRHLLALINDILDYSRFEAGQIALDMAEVAVASVCRDSVRMVAPTALARQIRLTSTLDQLATTVQADGRRLQQILVNLLTNAVKFTPNGGEVGLEVRGDAARQLMIFAVRDTGIGIAEPDLGRLFQPFVQIDSRLSRQYEGTGLGLALVRRLAEAHGGSVSVASAPGQGSCFSVMLPWHPRPAEPAAPPEPAAPALPAPENQRHALILLVEDSETNIEVIADYLPAHGYELAVVRDGGEVLALARNTPPALILMDIQLPVMDGITATQQIRADPALRDIPIVALTALVMPGDRERCLEAGADEYLAKPISLRTLLATIERLLGRLAE